ncbi:unnamed protein product [Ectocarpus sp. CCAP 1310/34]|nr:unnamed protein product [Ectocarpus sp. CCAP 1310/34]
MLFSATIGRDAVSMSPIECGTSKGRRKAKDCEAMSSAIGTSVGQSHGRGVRA